MTSREELEQRVEAALRRLDREGEDDLVSAGRVRRLRATPEGEVSLELDAGSAGSPELVAEIREAVAAVDGVSSVRVGAEGVEDEDAAESGTPPPGAGQRPAREGDERRTLPVMETGAGPAGGGPAPGGGEGATGDRQGSGPRPTAVDREASSRHPRDAPALPDVGHVLAVSSGKGGVGKSTVATNLAAAWALEGHRVGLLDADVYGPDIPTMFGVYDRPRMDDGEVVPLEAHGVKLMSLGFLVDEDMPAIWRGPIIQGIVRQFLQQVRWGELDYLVVDLPPGTGDAQLSLVQLVKVAGGVFVTTPQDVAVGGVLKGIRMFERLEIPVAGLVENMRGFVCPGCGDLHEIFGSGGGEKLAASLDISFLGSVPLGTAVREEGDRGMPTVVGRPDSPEARGFMDVARAVGRRLEELEAREGPGAEAGAAGDADPGERDAPERADESRAREASSAETPAD